MRVKVSKQQFHKVLMAVLEPVIPDFIELEAEPVEKGFCTTFAHFVGQELVKFTNHTGNCSDCRVAEPAPEGECPNKCHTRHWLMEKYGCDCGFDGCPCYEARKWGHTQQSDREATHTLGNHGNDLNPPTPCYCDQGILKVSAPSHPTEIESRYSKYVDEELSAHHFYGDIETGEGRHYLCAIGTGKADDPDGERVAKYINYLAEIIAHEVGYDAFYERWADKNPLLKKHPRHEHPPSHS